MSTVFDKAMQDALMADAAYLEQMTGDDHTPVFISDTIEEGDTCKSCGTGTYYFPPSENCSCFQNAPCGSCMDVQLTCKVCGEFAYE